VIHLDTSFLIRALVRGSHEDTKLRGWLSEGQVLGMSAIAWTEFLCGPLEATAVELAARVVGPQVPFAADDAVVAAGLFNTSGRRRGTLMDCMVAATAIGNGAALATTNPSDFKRFEQRGLVAP